MKSKVLLLIAFFTSSSLFSQLKQDIPLSLDLAIFLDKDQELISVVQSTPVLPALSTTIARLMWGQDQIVSLLGKTDLIATSLTPSSQAIPFIASTSLIAALIRVGFGDFFAKSFDYFNFYRTKVGEFILILPKLYLGKRTEKLDDLGLNASQFRPLKNYSNLVMFPEVLIEDVEKNIEIPKVNARTA